MGSDEMLVIVGRNIREAREAKGLSLRAFASSIGIDYAHLCNIENGRANPKVSTVLYVGEALGLKPVELFQERPNNER